MIKHFVLVFAGMAALLGQGVAQAQASKSDYRAIVGSNGEDYKGFKTIQAPALLQSANWGTSYQIKRLDYEVYSDTAGRMKFFLPPGTVAFNANLYYYYQFEEGKVALHFNQIPVTPFSSITANNAGGAINETVLQRLINNDEILYYSAGAPANSLVLSSPDKPIDPIAKGGYVYGNYQYPGGMLQRGLLKVYVKADCYTQWYNSASTQWDANGNPDENAEHTCEGSTGENPTPTLESVTVSASTLQVGAAQKLTLSPNPANASLPACAVQGTAYVVIAGREISLLPTAYALTANTPQTIACGEKTVTFTILPAVANSVQVKPLPPKTDNDGNLVVNIQLVRPASSIQGKTNTTVWIGGKIPKDGFFFTEDEWFFLTPNGWQMLLLPNPNLVAYQTKPVATETSFTIPIGLTAADLEHFGVEIHFGYVDDDGTFQNKGIIWSKN